MSLLRKRLQNLEAAIAPPERRPYWIWGRFKVCCRHGRKTKRKSKAKSMLQ